MSRMHVPKFISTPFSAAAEASLIIIFFVNLYKFDVRSPLRIVMKPLVTLIAPSAPENLYPRASKAPNERRFFLKSETYQTFVRGSNLSIKYPHMDVVDANSLTHGVVSHQNRASIIKLISSEPLHF